MLSSALELTEEVTQLLLGFDGTDQNTLLEIQTRFLEIGSILSKFPETEQLCAQLSQQLDPIYQGAAFSSLETYFYRGFDLFQRAIRITQSGTHSDESEIHQALSNDIAEYLSETQAPGEQAVPVQEETSLEPHDSNSSHPVSEKEIQRLIEVSESEFFEAFLSESENRLLRAQDIILNLDEQTQIDKEHTNELFRLFHTLKGEAGFVGLVRIAEFTHRIETMLDLVRSGTVSYDIAHTEALLCGIDLIRECLSCLDHLELRKYLLIDDTDLKQKISQTASVKSPTIGEVLTADGRISRSDAEEISREQQMGFYAKKFGQLALERGKIDEENLATALEEQQQVFKSIHKRSKDALINVRSSQIAELSALVQELWIAENQIDDERMNAIKKITSQLQHVTMSFLTIEVNKLYIKLRRLVHETSKKMGKNIEVQFLGSEMEIDRNLVETLEEPMLHMIRNSLDHGMEREDERIAAGKPPKGSLIVETTRRGNRVVISIFDDGRGLNPGSIRAKVLEKGLKQEHELSGMSREEILNLITLPGFSTADQITEFSGRGVGMDTVVAMIQEKNGRLEISSEQGKYTKFDLVFPLNVAIIDGMVLKNGDDLFVIPVAEIVECVQLSEFQIEKIKGDIEIFRLRGEVIPVIRLGEIFPERKHHGTPQIKAAVIAQNNGHKYAILVSDILEKNEVAIKPLGPKFSRLRGISAGTVFTGGTIGFILDIEQIVKNLRIESAGESA